MFGEGDPSTDWERPSDQRLVTVTSPTFEVPLGDKQGTCVSSQASPMFLIAIGRNEGSVSIFNREQGLGTQCSAHPSPCSKLFDLPKAAANVCLLTLMACPFITSPFVCLSSFAIGPVIALATQGCCVCSCPSLLVRGFRCIHSAVQTSIWPTTSHGWLP